MSHELKGREIFAEGMWNGLNFSSSDLEDIVANFSKLKDDHRVPLKFGHDADHNDGQPAIGWVERIFKEGTKLFADFTHMPRIVFDAIEQQLYRTISIELLFNVDNDGNKFNHVLDAVALLGADHPAVNSLADLDLLNWRFIQSLAPFCVWLSFVRANSLLRRFHLTKLTLHLYSSLFLLWFDHLTFQT